MISSISNHSSPGKRSSQLCAKKVVFFFVFFLCLLFFRVPYMQQPPAGEESIFLLTAISAQNGQKFKHGILYGKMDKLQVRSSTDQHPSFVYLMFHFFGKIANLIKIDLISNVWLIRLFVCVLFCFVTAYSAVQAVMSVNRKFWSFCTLVVALSSLFLMGASIQLQRDGTFGILPYVLFMGVVYSDFFNSKDTTRKNIAKAAILFVGFLAGFDKPERVLVWVIARMLTELFYKKICGNKLSKTIKYEIIGLVIGLSIEIPFDFDGMMYGWFGSFTMLHNINVGIKTSFLDYVASLRYFFPFTILLLFCSGILVFILETVKKIKNNEFMINDKMEFSVILYAVGTFLAALQLRWRGDDFPRYLSPAFVLLCLLSVRRLASSSVFDKKELLLYLIPFLLMLETHNTYPMYKNKSITSNFSDSTEIKCDVTVQQQCLKPIDMNCILQEKSKNWFFTDGNIKNDLAIAKNYGMQICKKNR